MNEFVFCYWGDFSESDKPSILDLSRDDGDWQDEIDLEKPS